MRLFGTLLGVVLTGAAGFAATNVDDLLILTFFFSTHSSRSGRWRIVTGQGLAVGAIVLLSLAGGIATHFLSPHRVGLLGILPILVGLRHFYIAGRDIGPARGAKQSPSVTQVAAVIFAGGADSMGVYLPWFAASTRGQMLVLAATFAGMAVLWCGLAAYLGGRARLQQFLRRFGSRLMAIVLVALGAYILLSSGALALHKGGDVTAARNDPEMLALGPSQSRADEPFGQPPAA
jgi:cadmium resistance protein CadD (predicted permease)